MARFDTHTVGSQVLASAHQPASTPRQRFRETTSIELDRQEVATIADRAKWVMYRRGVHCVSVTVDITGMLPTEEEFSKHLSPIVAPDKRSRH